MKIKKILLSLLTASLLLFSQTICFAKNKSSLNKYYCGWEWSTSAVARVEEKDYTEEVKTYIQTHKYSFGIDHLETSKGNFIIATMGQMPTGGYSFELGNITESESLSVVDVLFKSPSSGTIVTQVITYPVLVLKRNTLKAVKVRITANNGQSVLKEETFPALLNDSCTNSYENFIKNHISKRGVYSIKIGSKTYIGVFMGKQSTSGYSIDIISTKQTGGCWFVDLVFNRPSKDAVVTQAETYPYLVFEKKSTTGKTKVKVKDGLYNRTLLNTMLR